MYFQTAILVLPLKLHPALTVSGNSFLDGNDGIDIIGSASLTITGNLIDGNSRFGISGGGYIDSNTITNNQVGIHNPPSGTISNNNILGNTLNSIDATTSNVNAQNNWWGTTDIPTINQTIYDSKVDRTLGTVTFVPFLNQPNPTAPAIPATTPIITPIPTVLATPQPTEAVHSNRNSNAHDQSIFTDIHLPNRQHI